jgi:NTP pyrophosphatase (non-canonical NTP hydrolase)
MKFKEIEQLVIQWGVERKIYSKSNMAMQSLKLQEEVDELKDALFLGSPQINVYDAIGDIIVVLTHIAKFANTDLTSCYLHAYNEIKDRKGKVINGLFVKEL